jgi:hypothetical protein
MTFAVDTAVGVFVRTERRSPPGDTLPVLMRNPGTLTVALVVTSLGMAACTSPPATEQAQTMSIDTVAEEYVKLVLALGEHDRDYVDAYLGPEEWRAEATAMGLSVADIGERASGLLADLGGMEAGDGTELEAQRRRALVRTIESLAARARMLAGEELSFDEESMALYDARAPRKSAEEFEGVLEELDALLPGNGSLTDRLDEFRGDFVIPSESLDAVFQAAIDACREKTAAQIELPDGESFVVEYVTDKSWSGYNWYKGDFHSLIQVNTDLPIYIDRAIDLACHEGYPGHHVYNVLIERELVEKRGWTEFLVYPLFSPRSLIAEGTANFGIEVAFPGEERISFEREVLFPMAGLDANRVGEYYEVEDLVSRLEYAGNEAARGYLDGEMSAGDAVEWLMSYALMSRPRAEQRLRFIEQYRSYVINYNLGQDLVRDFIERSGGTHDDPDVRWRLFTELLSKPYLPSDLE